MANDQNHGKYDFMPDNELDSMAEATVRLAELRAQHGRAADVKSAKLHAICKTEINTLHPLD